MHALNFVVENNFRGGILVAIWVTEPPPHPGVSNLTETTEYIR